MEYKTDLQFTNDRFINIAECTKEDCLSELNETSHTMSIDPIDQSLIDQHMEQIAKSCTDSFSLSPALNQVISVQNINLNYAIINSSLIKDIMDTFQKNPTPTLIQAICELSYFSPTLTYILFHFNLANILFECVLSQNPENSCEALKFIQKMIPYGILNRAVLYGFGIFDVLAQFLSNEFNISQHEMAAHTALLFIAFDPVYGENSYSKVRSKLPKRSVILNQCRELNIPQKSMLNISSFLKKGNGICPNKGLYFLINFMLETRDESLSFYAFSITEYLSEYCEENVIKVVESTQFLKFVQQCIEQNVERIQIAIFNTISHIIHHSSDYYDRRLINCKTKFNPFNVGLAIFCSEDAPLKLRVATGRCIFYGINYIDFVQSDFSNNENIFRCLLDVFENSQMAVKAEACCIIISIISNCDENNRINYLSPDLILSFLNLLESYDEDQILKILRFFISLFNKYFDELAEVLGNEEILELFTNLASHENEKIADLANVLLKIISNLKEDEDEDQT